MSCPPSGNYGYNYSGSTCNTGYNTGCNTGYNTGCNTSGTPEQPPASAQSMSFTSPPAPFLETIGGLWAGRRVTIVGKPASNAQRVTINLQCGTNDTANIAFHFDVRLNYGSERVVVRNARISGNWGPESRDGGCPFTENVPFAIEIVAGDTSFKIMVNDVYFTEFPYRLHPLNIVDALKVAGDVQIYSIAIK